MTKLTKVQIQYLDTYIEKSGIEWFDLKVELVDHMSEKTIAILENNPELEFEKAVTKAKISFGTKGFRLIIVSRTKQIESAFYKRVFKYMLSFFTLPKIILTLTLTYVLIMIYDSVEDLNLFFNGLVVILFIFTVVFFWLSYKRKTIDKKKHLSLSHMQSVSQFVNFLAQVFSFSVTILGSVLYKGYNPFIFIVLWVVSFLFCIASEVVSRQIYKDQKALYYKYQNA